MPLEFLFPLRVENSNFPKFQVSLSNTNFRRIVQHQTRHNNVSVATTASFYSFEGQWWQEGNVLQSKPNSSSFHHSFSCPLLLERLAGFTLCAPIFVHSFKGKGPLCQSGHELQVKNQMEHEMNGSLVAPRTRLCTSKWHLSYKEK